MARMDRLLCIAAVLVICVGRVHAEAEVKLEITRLHACCGGCIADIDKALASVEGAKGTYDKVGKKADLTAKDAATAEKVLEALGNAGFHGKTNNKDIVMKDDSGATAGKVKTLTLTAGHICCGSCVTAVKGAIKTVDGATPGALKAHDTSFEITGDFDAVALIKALDDAGFHCKVKK